MNSDRDEAIITLLDALPHALALEEILPQVGGTQAALLADLARLAEIGEVKMTADTANRGYYRLAWQLR